MSKNQFSFELLFEKGKIQLALISSCLGTSSLQKGKKEKKCLWSTKLRGIMALPVVSKGLPQRLCFNLGELHRVYSLSSSGHLLKTTQFISSNCIPKCTHGQHLFLSATLTCSHVPEECMAACLKTGLSCSKQLKNDEQHNLCSSFNGK